MDSRGLKEHLKKACETGNLGTVDLYAGDNRVDLNEPLDDGRFLLHICSSRGHGEVARILLGNGALVNRKRKMGGLL